MQEFDMIDKVGITLYIASLFLAAIGGSSVVIDYADLNPYKGRLARHRWRESMTGIVLASRTKRGLIGMEGDYSFISLRSHGPMTPAIWTDRKHIMLLLEAP